MILRLKLQDASLQKSFFSSRFFEFTAEKTRFSLITTEEVLCRIRLFTIQQKKGW